MAKVVVVGKTSFLARRLLTLGTKHQYVAVSHRDVESPGLFDGADCVVNFAYDARLRLEPYDRDLDFDVRLAEVTPPATRFVMMSSRMVYDADARRPCVENSFARGLNQYGKNKLETERRLRDSLGDRLTVLRVANVLGWEPVAGHRSFMHAVIERLKREGRVVYDVSPFVRRDFVTDRYLVSAIEAACELRIGGVFNVGSGIGLEIGQIAMWIIQGCGRGEFVVTSPREVDAFWLDVSRASRTFGPPPTLDDLRRACLDLGRSIAEQEQ